MTTRKHGFAGITKTALLAGASALALVLLAFPGEARAQTTPPTLVTSERGLSEPVPPIVADIGALNIQEAADLAALLNSPLPPTCQWTSSGTTVTPILPYLNGTSPALGGCFGLPGAQTLFAIATFEHRIFMTEIVNLIDNRDSTSSDDELRGVLANGSPITLGGATLADTRPRLLRAARTADGRRYFAGAEVQTGGGPVVVADRILSELLTGRDIYTGVSTRIGPGPQTAGTRVNCPAPADAAGCAGGITIEVHAESTLFVADLYTTLFITTFVERTLTGGTTFYDVELTPLPSGAVHAALANAGFLITNRFLRRLTDGPADAGLGRGAFWSEAWGAQAEFDGEGVLGATSVDSFGFAGGAVVRPWEHWRFGLAGEYGESDLSIADVLTPEAGEATHLKIGAHAAFDRGRFHANAAAMVGAFDVETIGYSALGNAEGDYDATISGASMEAGYDVPVGALTLTPTIGASVLSWERDGFSETGGPAPLTLASEDESQTRVWAGLNARWTPEMGEGRLDVNAYVRGVSISGDTRAHVTTFDPQLPGEPLVVSGPDFGDSAAELGASLDYRLSERTASRRHTMVAWATTPTSTRDG
jgi:outer membrane autotransporter protein